MWRATAACLPGGGTVVVSPLPAEDGLGQLGRIGAPRFLLAPNHFHHLGVSAHLARFPQAIPVASRAAQPRLHRQTGRTFEELAALEAALPAGAAVVEPAGTRNGEAWLVWPFEGGVAWVVGDGLFHLAEVPWTFAGLGVRALGVGPGLRVGATFRCVGLNDRRAYGRWVLDRLERDRPTMLVPAHGEVLRGTDLVERVAGVVRRDVGL
jgi:hypothetical protein